MKKYFYIIATLIVSALTFTACGDDDEGTQQGTQNPEEEIAGTYAGTWHQIITDSNSDTIGVDSADGVVKIEAERQWVVRVTACEAGNVITSEKSDVANCSGNSISGYGVINNSATVLGNFSMRIIDGQIKNFVYKSTKTVVEGRKRKTYNTENTFNGTLEESASLGEAATESSTVAAQ